MLQLLSLTMWFLIQISIIHDNINNHEVWVISIALSSNEDIPVTPKNTRGLW